MTVKVKNSDLVNGQFRIALTKLKRQTDLSIRASYTILLFEVELKKHQEIFQELRMSLLSKYGSKEADGSFKLNEEKTEILLADKASFDKEYKELLAIEVEVSPLSLEAIKEVKIAPAELEPMLKFLTT